MKIKKIVLKKQKNLLNLGLFNPPTPPLPPVFFFLSDTLAFI